MSVDRKEFICGGLAAAASAAVLRTQAAPPDLRGRVSSGGYGLAGVIVSDGLACVLTGKDGSFRLPHRTEARFVTVSVPSGYRAATRFRRIDPAADSYAFDLTKWPASAGRGCRFAQVADSEIRDDGSENRRWIADVKKVAADTRCAFVVHTGDICYLKGMQAHAKLMNSETMGLPVMYCVGNHDLVKGDYGEQTFEGLFGPCWYSFDAGGIHFIVLPMVESGDFRPGYTEDMVADWLRADLALVGKKRPVMAFSHMLVHHRNEREIGLVIGKEHPLDLRTVCDFKGFVYGHVHTTYTSANGGVTFMCSTNANFGGIDHSPELLRVFDVKPDGSFVTDNHYGRRPMRDWVSERADALWDRQLPAPVLFCTPVVSGGTVFVGTSDDENRGTGTVVALDAKSGAIVWKRQVANSVKNRLVVAQGNVIVQDAGGTVYAFAASGGKTVWQLRLPFSFLALMSAVTASADGRTVYVGIGKSLSAVDAATGRVVWQGAPWRCESVAGGPAIGEDRMVWAANWDGLECHDLATGRNIWSLKGEPWRFPGADPLITGGKVVVASQWHIGEADLATGAALRTKPLKASPALPSGPILDAGDRYLFGTQNDGLIAVDKESLDVIWRAPVDRSSLGVGAYRRPGRTVNTSPVAISEKTVCAACADGTIRFWETATGKEVRRITTGAPYLAGVAAANGRLFAADLSGHIRAF